MARLGIKARKKEENKQLKEEAKELVIDMETVRNAIQTLKDFEKEKHMTLLNSKGVEQYRQMYRKYESQSKVKELINGTIEEKIEPLIIKQEEIMETQERILEEYQSTSKKLDTLLTMQGKVPQDLFINKPKDDADEQDDSEKIDKKEKKPEKVEKIEKIIDKKLPPESA